MLSRHWSRRPATPEGRASKVPQPATPEGRATPKGRATAACHSCLTCSRLRRRLQPLDNCNTVCNSWHHRSLALRALPRPNTYRQELARQVPTVSCGMLNQPWIRRRVMLLPSQTDHDEAHIERFPLATLGYWGPQFPVVSLWSHFCAGEGNSGREGKTGTPLRRRPFLNFECASAPSHTDDRAQETRR